MNLQPKQPRVQGDRRLRPHPDPRRVGVIGIDDDICVEPRRDDRRNEQKGRSPAFEPFPAEGLGDGDVAQIVPAGMRGGVERLTAPIRPIPIRR